MLIEGSSGSSGALVGEHQPDELMRDGGRWAGRPLVVMSEMKVSQEDVAARVQPWRGVGAGTASRFMANTALSRGARTNGAVCAAPGGLTAWLRILSQPANLTGNPPSERFGAWKK